MSIEKSVSDGRIVTKHCHIRGIVPCIMSNGQMADPANYYAQLSLETRAERKRGKAFTEEQGERYYKNLFVGQLYLKDRKKLTTPAWPAENVEAMIRRGAKKSKGGNDALIGITVIDDFPLIYDGPKDAEGLWNDERFPFYSMPLPKGGGARTVNCRCRFQQWEFKFNVLVDTRIINPDTLHKWLDDAGWQVGLSAWTPKYGRFEVVGVN